MTVMEWPEFFRSMAISSLALAGWLITSRATYLLFKGTIDDNKEYTKQLLAAIRVLDGK